MVKIKCKFMFFNYFLVQQTTVFVWCLQVRDYSPQWVDQLIESVNSQNTSWTATKSPRIETIMNSQRMLGDLPYVKAELHSKHHNLKSANFAPSFDSREHWPNCAKIIGFIRNQGKCGSCWAVSAASVMSDRICIGTNGSTLLDISAEDLLTCCPNCLGYPEKLCSGGYAYRAFKFWKTKGVVSGGEQRLGEGCKPDSPSETYLSGTHCLKKCTNSKYKRRYTHDKHKANVVYQLPYKDTKQMQHEILSYGPVLAYLIVYDDFLVYKNGVYRHVSGRKLSDHFVKVLGWGTEKLVPYWLCTNSWSTTWGMQGFFKIVRGENHCEIEREVIAGGLHRDRSKRKWILGKNSGHRWMVSLKYVYFVEIVFYMFQTVCVLL